ncbi:MAG: VanW family protein [Niameybacter sp.]
MATNKKKGLIVSVLIGLVLILGVICSALAYVYHVVSAYDLVYAKQVYINDIPIGGLTPEEALKEVSRQLDTYHENQFITLVNKEQTKDITLKQFSPQTNLQACLDEAYLVGHKGNYFERFKATEDQDFEPHHFATKTTYEQSDIEQVLEEVQEVFTSVPVDATITRENRQFTFTLEEMGYSLDIPKTAGRIHAYITTEPLTKEPIQVIMKEVLPSITKAHLSEEQTPLASFSTAYNNADLNRNENLKLSSRKINIQLQPGEIFSLATQLEPISEEAGYRNSKVIVNGKLEEGIGGGVCQIASTLYNALLLTDVEIYSRANHSLPVAYVPLGRDATYATDIIDFKFRNNSEYPLFVEAYCENNHVIVNLFGYKGLKLTYDEVKFASELIETIEPPAPTIIKDDTMYVDQKVQEVRPLEGKKVKLYRLFYKDGELVNKQLINTSTYRVRGEVIRVGTKPRGVENLQPVKPEKAKSEPVQTKPIISETSPTVSEEVIDLPLMPSGDNPAPLN